MLYEELGLTGVQARQIYDELEMMYTQEDIETQLDNEESDLDLSKEDIKHIANRVYSMRRDSCDIADTYWWIVSYCINEYAEKNKIPLKANSQTERKENYE